MDKLISVIIPVYNVEKYLGRCVYSIINQTYKNLEIILVDDGSPDRCGEMCDEYAKRDKRIKVIHKMNEGASAARNTGIDAAQGEFIVFADSDDWLEPDAMQKLIRGYLDTGADWICSSYKIVYRKLTEVRRFHGNTYENTKIADGCFDNWQGVNTPWAKLFKTSYIRDNHIYFMKDVMVGEDTLFNLEYVKQCRKIAFIPEVTYNYSCMGTGQITSAYHENFNEYMYNIGKKISELGTSNKEKCYNCIKEICLYALMHYTSHLKYSKKCTDKLTETYVLFENILVSAQIPHKYPISVPDAMLIKTNNTIGFYIYHRLINYIRPRKDRLLGKYEKTHCLEEGYEIS